MTADCLPSRLVQVSLDWRLPWVRGLSLGPYNAYDNRSYYKDLWVSDQA